MAWVILPVKDFVKAKTRLSGVLASHERRALMQAMVEDVLSVVSKHPDIEGVLLVSDDPSAELLAEKYQVDCIDEGALDSHGLNNTIQRASDYLIEHKNAEVQLVLHADIPLLDSGDISALLEALKQGSAAIAPDTKGAGTNALLFRKSEEWVFCFGHNSFSKHKDFAKQKGLKLQSVEHLGLALDVDEPEDIYTLLEQFKLQHGYSHTRQFIDNSDIEKRLVSMKLVEKNTSSKNALFNKIYQQVTAGQLLTDEDALQLAQEEDTAALAEVAAKLRDQAHLNVASYSRKVFIPLTQLCRDVCHYCTFAQTPKKVEQPYMSVEQVLEICRQGAAQGCKEALFTLGEKPELRYSTARKALAELGFESTLDYVVHVAERVLKETGLLPHINAGCMTAEEISKLRKVSASMGIMLESASPRLCEKGMPHYGSPDKDPELRLQTIELAGQAKVPFTSGILIGIGETRRERIESLLALRKLHQRYGHLQEIIVQNFRAKPNTLMAEAPEPDLNELLWTIAVARIIFGPDMSIQAPPNLSPGVLEQIVAAGINDWGGVSPLTPDFVNPEAPWPHLDKLAAATESAGKYLEERLTIYPAYARDQKKWLAEELQTVVLRNMDTEGFARTDSWSPGSLEAVPKDFLPETVKDRALQVSHDLSRIVTAVRGGGTLSEAEIIRLFRARGDDYIYLCQQADKLREQQHGDTVTYVVNRNINYTNVCYFKCQFCAFSKGKISDELRGRPYDLADSEIARRCDEAWQRGATEVCMQGGIHPDYTGETYLNILNAVRSATPDMHIHAFSPLEVWQGAETLGLSLKDYLQTLKANGLHTLPGTAAEILDDDVRAELCPDKINTDQWLEVMSTAHSLGIKTTATIMYGHIEGHEHWARHLIRLCDLQKQTGGFTEFVPLPFVSQEAPNYLRGKARKGPTFREAVLMHAVARIVLHSHITNIQTSWVKMGEEGVKACLESGANDLGGTLMNESITRAAGAQHGQEWSPELMIEKISTLGRQAKQRTTLYGEVSQERQQVGRNAEIVADIINTPVEKRTSLKA